VMASGQTGTREWLLHGMRFSTSAHIKGHSACTLCS
jgi:hypothetical protein